MSKRRSTIVNLVKDKLGAEATKFFTNCGQVAINGPAYNESKDFIDALDETKYLYSSEAERILEEMRSLNVILETMQQGNQYIPEEINGKCPKLIIEAKVDGFHIGVEWW